MSHPFFDDINNYLPKEILTQEEDKKDNCVLKTEQDEQKPKKKDEKKVAEVKNTEKKPTYNANNNPNLAKSETKEMKHYMSQKNVDPIY